MKELSLGKNFMTQFVTFIIDTLRGILAGPPHTYAKEINNNFYKKLLTNHFPYGIINTDRKEVNKMLDKAIFYGKEHRKPYYGSEAYSCSCRNHGGCPWCEGNRLYNTKRKLEQSNYSLKNYLTNF